MSAWGEHVDVPAPKPYVHLRQLVWDCQSSPLVQIWCFLLFSMTSSQCLLWLRFLSRVKSNHLAPSTGFSLCFVPECIVSFISAFLFWISITYYCWCQELRRACLPDYLGIDHLLEFVSKLMLVNICCHEDNITNKPQAIWFCGWICEWKKRVALE